jgi:hypothetical protein
MPERSTESGVYIAQSMFYAESGGL